MAEAGQARPEQVMAGVPTKVGGSRGSSLVRHLSTEAAAGTTRAPRRGCSAVGGESRRALEMKAEERQVQEESGAMLITKQGQPTLPQMQSNRPASPTKIPYSHRMLQWDSDVHRYSEEFGGDVLFLALASLRKGATMLPASREEIARREFWEADVKEWAAIFHTKTIGKRRSHLELAAVLNMGFARNHKEDLSKGPGPGGRKKKTRI
uniref:Uncharacterized protein n=1 Tax=Chromera velia CCMP2878 TaxID=1169474 RepID=A0A0G4HFG4_9ALVE|eukprot:Cvel_26936.t1-p1 / transcript=Cvel_26936.t1 / gene=Cvel_26936 / organism=Chromera_velia_CCMP2878 / gene_product=hypothetical protein / transcript_product=hypothetical protein / location=Cvel_scaffold3280:3278-4342(-) / protein_length=207 / sequence_SO=supercontig / SO=protein_coding / is_pseudo=false